MSEIEARPTRVPSPYGAEIRDKGKGEAAEVGNGSCAVFCWLVGEDPPDCHNFVERYRRVGKPVSVLPVLQIICRKCSTRAFTAFSVSELVGADNEGPTPPTEPNFHSERKQHHEPQKNHRYPARSPHAACPHRLRRGHDVSRAGRKRPGCSGARSLANRARSVSNITPA